MATPLETTPRSWLRQRRLRVTSSEQGVSLPSDHLRILCPLSSLRLLWRLMSPGHESWIGMFEP
jgi:hypothetical protein